MEFSQFLAQSRKIPRSVGDVLQPWWSRPPGLQCRRSRRQDCLSIPTHSLHFVPGASFTLCDVLALTEGARRATGVSARTSPLHLPLPLRSIFDPLGLLRPGTPDLHLGPTQDAYFIKAEPYSPLVLLDLFQAYPLAVKSMRYKHVLPQPAHSTARRHTSHVPIGGVVHHRQASRIHPRRRLVVRSRRLLPQRLVRPLLSLFAGRN